MPTPTYDLLESVTLATAASSVTFSSIDQTFKDLVIVSTGFASAVSAYTYGWLNGDTTNGNYSYVALDATGGAFSFTGNSPFLGLVYAPADGNQALNINQILDYSATDKHKSILNRFNNGGTRTQATVLRWANTAAITSIELNHGSGTDTYAAGCTFNLYGIAG